MIPGAIDWDTVYRPAVIALLNGQTMPAGFYNPIWVLFPLIPFAVLPYELGRVLLLVCGVGSFGLVAHRFGAKPIGVIAFILSPLVFDSLAWGNVEWVTLLGFVTVQPIGLLLLLIKPQMTFVAILLIVWQAWQSKKAIRLLTVPILAIGVAVLCGWLNALTRYPTDAGINVSLFPLSLAVGLPLVLYAYRKSKLNFAVAASPCFAPTLSPQSWLVSLLAVARSTPEMIAASVGLWLYIFLQR